VAAGIEIAALPDRPFDGPDGSPAPRPAASLARAFGSSGGVAAAVLERLSTQGKAAPRALVINGLDKATIKEISRWAETPPQADIVEVMACQGGCVNGPCAVANPRAAAQALAAYAVYSQSNPATTTPVHTPANSLASP
jgi:iron only hydrogenase large subunit-like protein